ncbi:MAG: hypothetical protein ACK4L8_10145 [Nitrincola lacisaponensis]|uniref:hypothetical protein n=1 Tax=Nitrincola lacisaponensis TaxID=267850 RepID=UPI00391C8627
MTQQPLQRNRFLSVWLTLMLLFAGLSPVHALSQGHVQSGDTAVQSSLSSPCDGQMHTHHAHLPAADEASQSQDSQTHNTFCQGDGCLQCSSCAALASTSPPRAMTALSEQVQHQAQPAKARTSRLERPPKS